MVVKLQRHPSRKGKDGKEYFKWEIIIPDKDIKNARFEEGEELEIESKNGEIKLRKL